VKNWGGVLEILSLTCHWAYAPFNVSDFGEFLLEAALGSAILHWTGT